MKNKKRLKDKKWSKNKNLSIDPTQEIGKQRGYIQRKMKKGNYRKNSQE